jgi:hypothetical protein
MEEDDMEKPGILILDDDIICGRPLPIYCGARDLNHYQGRVESRFNPALPHQTGLAVLPHLFFTTKHALSSIPLTLALCTGQTFHRVSCGETWRILLSDPCPYAACEGALSADSQHGV